MKQELIIILAICAFAAAFVPRDRRAVNTEEEEHPLSSSSSTSSSSTSTSAKPKEICAPQTPCAWSIYRPVIKFIEIHVPSSYCLCGPGLECIINEDDTMVSTYVHRCRTPEPEQPSSSDTDSDS